MPLSPAWVERIHTRLLVRYGTAWLRMWEGIDAEAVKADWAEELGRCSGPAIQHALENLPADRPPNVHQFKALCLNKPEPLPVMLPAPEVDKAVVAAIVNGIKRPAGHDPKAWAHRLKEREDGGDRLTPAQRAMWRAALRPDGAIGEIQP